MNLDHLLHRKFFTGRFFLQELPRVTIVFAPSRTPTPPLSTPFGSLPTILQLPSVFSGTATQISNISTTQISDLAPFCRTTGPQCESVSNWKARVIYLMYHIVYFSSFEIQNPELPDVQCLKTVILYFFPQLCCYFYQKDNSRTVNIS